MLVDGIYFKTDSTCTHESIAHKCVVMVKLVMSIWIKQITGINPTLHLYLHIKPSSLSTPTWLQMNLRLFKSCGHMIRVSDLS